MNQNDRVLARLKEGTWLQMPEALHWSPPVTRLGGNLFHRSCGLLAAILPLFPRRLQPPVPLGLNLLLVPSEHVFGVM